MPLDGSDPVGRTEVFASRAGLPLPRILLGGTTSQERASSEKCPSVCAQAIFSHKPLNVASNTWWFCLGSAASSAALFWSAANNVTWLKRGEAGGVSILRSAIVFGGQPVTKARGDDVVFRLSPVSSEAVPRPSELSSAFGIVSDSQSGVSHCGRSPPPTLALSDDGSMDLTFPSGSSPDALHGIFVVPGVCNRSDCGATRAPYRLDQLDGGTIPGILVGVDVISVEELAKAGGLTYQFFDLRTPWPAYLAPLGAYLISGFCMFVLALLKFTGSPR